jgi:hypothetical protein
MKELRKYSTALRESMHVWINDIKHLDLLVGIPCYNNEDTIRYVVSTVADGLHQHFSNLKTGILVSDGGSLDDTRERAYGAIVPPDIERKVTIYRGIPGKGTSFRAVFEAACRLGAHALLVVDSDLKSIRPEWIKLMAEPVLHKEVQYLVPYYFRHKYDGTITNQIVYPITRALYGHCIRQPIGGDFAIAPEILELYLKQDVWTTDVARFGIDIWMTTTAINEAFKVEQIFLGAKLHDAKDPATDLAPMFRQVVSTLFYLMGKYEESWRKIKGSCPVNLRGEREINATPEQINVNLDKLRDEFIDGFEHFSPMYRQIVEPANYIQLEKIIKKAKEDEPINFSPELWAKVVYDFAFTYQTWARNRRRLVDIMTPLYFGRTAAYCQGVAVLNNEEAEKVIEEQALAFEKLKPYLIEKYEVWE